MLRLRQKLTWMLTQLLPPACPLCSQTFPSDWTEPFCAQCLAGFPPLATAQCICCALPFPATKNSSHLCGECTASPPPFGRVYALGRYDGALRDTIHQFKFNNRVSLDRPLAQLLNRQIPVDSPFDLIVPVPLSRIKMRRRSYNQSLLLAREIGRCRKLPVSTGLLTKEVETIAQHDLSAKQRKQNLSRVFHAQGQLQGKRILLVDDVMTTGSTLRACGNELLAAGAAEIEVAIVGRA